MSDRSDDDRQDLYHEFNDRVNMTPKQLEEWLQTDESKEAGWHGGDDEGGEGGETVGHESGRHILRIKHKKKAELDEDDYDHMNKVIGYIKRHSKQRPDHPPSELEEMTWTHSLKNWGHDPLK